MNPGTLPAPVAAVSTPAAGSTLAPPSPASVTARPVAWWVEHFRASRAREWRIPWDSPATLSPEETRRIARSIAEFQRGESSEAHHYLRLSSLFSLENRDAAFHEASVLFVREENDHAALLLRFMNGTRLPPRNAVFADKVFRRVRALGDLGWSCRVLLVAELVAQEYYPCLRDSTTHPVLRRVCDKLIHDEFAHIRFQVERIAHLEISLPPLRRRLRAWLQGALLIGAALVVYSSHRAVLARSGGLRFFRRLIHRFLRATRAIETIRPGDAGLPSLSALRSDGKFPSENPSWRNPAP